MVLPGGTITMQQAEVERHANEEQYRTLFEMAPDVIYSISAEDHTFTALSPAFETVTGWSVDEWLGKPFAGIVHPDDLPLAVEKFQEGLRGETPAPYELRILSRSGGYLVGEFRSRPQIENGRVVGKIGVARDITERKRAENALRFLADASTVLASSLDYQTTLVNVARLAVPRIADWCVVDIVEEDGSIQRLAVAHVDPAKEELASEVQRRYPSDPSSSQGVAAAIRAGEPRLFPEISDAQLVAAARDPEHLAMLRRLGFRSAMVVPLVARGRTLGAISLVSAESGHRYGPEDLTMAEDLARDAALAVDNARLYQEAQEALRLRDEFLSIASHELKSPLTSVRMHTQMLQRAVQRGDLARLEPERVLQTLEADDRQIKRITTLIDQLLDVSRIAAGRLDLEREEMDLASLVREVATRFEDTAAAAGSELIVCADGSIVGRWDRSRIDQVVTNLLSNAVKYGRGEPIHVALEADGAVARLTVRDQGIGIASEDLTRIFDRFERAVTGQPQSGLGLGLYICRQLVEAHGGTIQVTSRPDAGSTFSVELPIALEG